MKAAASVVALPRYDHSAMFPALRALGLEGVEVAPSWVWEGGWTAAAVDAYRRAVEGAGLRVAGLHRLLDHRPDLGLFQGTEGRRATADALVALSALCRDLGGRTLVFGAGRRRGAVPVKQAWAECRAFLEALLPRIEAHGTVLCFEPLGPEGSDFCTRAGECRVLVDALEHPSLGVQMNSKAQTENDDRGHVPFHAVRGRLDHFSACEPGWAVLGSTGRVDHADFRRHLLTIRYDGWVSVNQRATALPLDGLERGIRFLHDQYLRPESRRHLLTKVAAVTAYF